jgi:hypothetical protein
MGDCHDQGDAKWIVIRGQLRGHNDIYALRAANSQPGVGRPQVVFGGFSYYPLVMIFFNIVTLIMEFTHVKRA